jgi:hypothetical protein
MELSLALDTTHFEPADGHLFRANRAIVTLVAFTTHSLDHLQFWPICEWVIVTPEEAAEMCPLNAKLIDEHENAFDLITEPTFYRHLTIRIVHNEPTPFTHEISHVACKYVVEPSRVALRMHREQT